MRGASIFVSFFLLSTLSSCSHENALFLVSNNLGQLSAESPTTSRVIADGLSIPSAFEFSYAEQLVIYIGDQQVKHNDYISVIRATNFTSLQTYNLYAANHGNINAIALDWFNMMIYWCDFKEETISVGEIDLESMTITKHRTLFSRNLSYLKYILVDPVGRSLFWLKSAEFTQIETAGLDGSDRNVLIDDRHSSGRDLKIDIASGRLFWLDESNKRICSASLKGEDLRCSSVPSFRSSRMRFLTVSNDNVYFVNDRTVVTVSQQEMNSTADFYQLKLNQQPYALKVFGPDIQTTPKLEGNLNCVPARFLNQSNTGSTGCSFLCLSSPSNPAYSCICPTGVSSNEAVSTPAIGIHDAPVTLSKTLTCPAYPNQFLLVARPPRIFMLSLDENHLWSIGGSPYPRSSLVRVDFDPISECIYWVDNAIYRLKLGEQHPVVVIEPANGALQTLDGLAVDWVVGNLYWSTGGNREIWVSRLDGAWPRFLISLDGFGEVKTRDLNTDDESSSDFPQNGAEEPAKRRPAALAIDPINRYLFFNVWSGTRGRIERTWLDGTHREVVVDQNHTVWPNGLALDFGSQQLYYVDAYLGVINRVSYAGGEPTQIVSGHLQHPFGFDLLGDNLYWSDWQTVSISQANKHTGEDLRALKTLGVDEALMGIRAVDLTIKKNYRASICSDSKKSGCSHLCFMLPAGTRGERETEEDLYYCTCPPEYALDADGKTCVVPDFMLLYSLDAAGLRRMSLPKPRLPSHSQRSGADHRRSGNSSSITMSQEVQFAAAETAAMVSNQVFNQVPLPFLRRVIRFDVHISEERVYWVEDSAPQCISMAFLNGTDKETLLCLFRDFGGPSSNTTSGSSGGTTSSASQPRDSIVGLALDWLTNSLYFCVDGERPKLEVIDLKYRHNPVPSSSAPSSGGGQFPGRKKFHWSSSVGNPHRSRRSIVPPWMMPAGALKGDDTDGAVGSDEDYLPSDDYPSYDFNPVTDRFAESVDNYRLVLLHNLSSPRDLVVHPKKRLLFWLDGTHNARFNIFSAGLDGRNHRLLWSGVGVVMSFAIDYTTDRLYWLNWVSKCIESVSLNGEDWFSVNPILPSARSPGSGERDGVSPDTFSSSASSSSPTADFHPYAIDAFQGAVLFSELTTQSVYRVQIPVTTARFNLPIGSQLNLPAELLLRGPPHPPPSSTAPESSKATGSRSNFLVLGLFVAGLDRQDPEPGHRCAPASSASTGSTSHLETPGTNPRHQQQHPLHATYPKPRRNHASGPICQALCLGAPLSVGGGSRGVKGPQSPVFLGRGGGTYPPGVSSAYLLDDRSPRFTCACPTQFTLASDGYSCLEPQRSLLILTSDGSITRFTPDDFPATNLLTISPLSLPTHDHLSTGSSLLPVGSWYLPGIDQPFDEHSLPLSGETTRTIEYAHRWASRHRVVAAAFEELANSGIFFLLQPTERMKERSVGRTAGAGRVFGSGRRKSSEKQSHRSSAPTMDEGSKIAFIRLGFLEFAAGEVTLWEGGPLVPMPEDNWSSFVVAGESRDVQLSRRRRHLSSSAIQSAVKRPRWSLAFDPINQVVFWSDAVTGLIGAEDSRAGRSLGLVANLTEASRTILELVVEARSGQLFQLTANAQFSECRIEATFLDGSERRLLHEVPLQSQCPHSLAYSAKLAQIFWVDPSQRRIQSLHVGGGNAKAKPETVVIGASPVPKSLAVLPESTALNGATLWLTWYEPIRLGEANSPVRLLYAPINSLFAGTPGIHPLPQPLVSPPDLPTHDPSMLFMLPVRGGGLGGGGDLSWHPCAGPSHGKCTHFCLPKASASSPSLPLNPGPLSPAPPLSSSPLPQSLWRTVRRCACAMGSNLVDAAAATGAPGGDDDGGGTVCSSIPDCLPPNLFCRMGPASTAAGGKGRIGYFLSGEGPFPQQGTCLPAFKVCDGVVDCKDGSDELNCPPTCPEYECNDGRCLPFADRCNGVIDCDSDELCCGSDQFECRRRPQSSPILSTPHAFYSAAVGNAWASQGGRRCLPRDFVCNRRPDCSDGWDEASCETDDTTTTDASRGSSAKGKDGSKSSAPTASSPGGSEFPSVYTVVIVSSILVVLIVFSLIGYICSKRWPVFASPYMVHAEQLDVLLVPTEKSAAAVGSSTAARGGSGSANRASKLRTTRSGGGRHAGSATGCGGDIGVSMITNTMENQEDSAATRRGYRGRRRRRGHVGSSSQDTMSPSQQQHAVGATPVTAAPDWCCNGCATASSPAYSHSHQKRNHHRDSCVRSAAGECYKCRRHRYYGGHQYQRHHRQHPKMESPGRSCSPTCKCDAGGSSKYSDADCLDNASSNDPYWSSTRAGRSGGPLSKCPPAPPPSSLPSPPPSPTTATVAVSTRGHTFDPPAPPPSKLHPDDDPSEDEEAGDYEDGEESLDYDDSSELSGSSSATPSPCRHQQTHRNDDGSRSHRRNRRRRHHHQHNSRRPHQQASISSSEHYYQQQHGGQRQRPRNTRVSFRSPEGERAACGGHCPQCGSRQQRHRRSVLRRNTFAIGRRGSSAAAVTETYHRVEVSAANFVEGSSVSSSSGRKASSNISSEYYPRETVNPPPSPITELTYAALPLTLLKQPALASQAPNLSNSSGSSGAHTQPQISFGAHKTFGRGGCKSSIFYPPGDFVFNLSKPVQLPQMAATYIAAASSTSQMHQHQHNQSSPIVPEGSSLTTATTTTSTTTIQNVHVVILASNNEVHPQCQSCSSATKSDYDQPSVLECAIAGDISTARCLRGNEQEDQQPQLAREPPAIPEEPREQAEGEEADENNPPARAPFAQFSVPKND